MSGVLLHAVFSGILFGIWPLLMQRSGIVNVYVSTAVMEVFVLSTLLPFGIANFSASEFVMMNWPYTISASVSAAIGVLIFNGGLAKTTETTVSSFFVMMMVVQVIVPATYYMYMNGGVTTSKALGFMFAILAAYFLSK